MRSLKQIAKDCGLFIARLVVYGIKTDLGMSADIYEEDYSDPGFVAQGFGYAMAFNVLVTLGAGFAFGGKFDLVLVMAFCIGVFTFIGAYVIWPTIRSYLGIHFRPGLAFHLPESGPSPYRIEFGDSEINSDAISAS